MKPVLIAFCTFIFVFGVQSAGAQPPLPDQKPTADEIARYEKAQKVRSTTRMYRTERPRYASSPIIDRAAQERNKGRNGALEVTMTRTR